MNITVTITAAPELMNVLQALAKSFTGHSSDGPTNGKVIKAKDTATQDAKADFSSEAAESKTLKNAKDFTIESVRDAVQKASQLGKRDQVKALLADFGAEKVTNLQKTQYADFVKKLQTL